MSSFLRAGSEEGAQQVFREALTGEENEPGGRGGVESEMTKPVLNTDLTTA